MKYSMTSLESHVESTHLARYMNIPIQCDTYIRSVRDGICTVKCQ